MVFVNYTFALLILYLGFLVAMNDLRSQQLSGPFYYLDMGPECNSLQPEYRIPRELAMHRPHALEAECFNNGAPYRVTTLSNGIRGFSTYYLIDGYGRLRYVGRGGRWGMQVRQIGERPAD